MLPSLTTDHSQIPEKSLEDDNEERAQRQPDPQLLSSPTNMSLKPPFGLEGGEPHAQEDHQARFYDQYHKVAEEYDKEFLKKHDEDLNTTLIFVSSLWGLDDHTLTELSGGSFLRGHFRIHYRSKLTAPARSQRRDRRPPPRPHLQDRQHHIRKQHSLPPAMVRASPRDSPRSSHPLRQSRRLTLFRLFGGARKAVAEPLRFNRQARVGHRPRPESTAKT